MKAPKLSPLAVSSFLNEIQFIKRGVKIQNDESGFPYVHYSGEATIQDRFEPQAFAELLKLIPAYRIQRPREIEPQRVIEFLNRFGVVGISDLAWREDIVRLVSNQDALLRELGYGSKSREVIFEKGFEKLGIGTHLFAIREGSEVPFSRVVTILEVLARSARLYTNLLDDPHFAKGEDFELHEKNKKRIVSAWYGFGGNFKDTDDPASSKFNLHEEWTLKVRGKRSPRFRQAHGDQTVFSPLDLAEEALAEFSDFINETLAIVTQKVLTTQESKDFDLRNTGLEVAFCSYIVSAFRERKVRRVCEVCGSIFLPERIKEKNLYCGEPCSKKVRNRKYRKKKKVSATKAESKVTTKARKEKK